MISVNVIKRLLHLYKYSSLGSINKPFVKIIKDNKAIIYVTGLNVNK